MNIEPHYIEDKCGIYTIVHHQDIYKNIVEGLNLLQHRGRESAGISYLKNDQLHTYKALGLVKDIFDDFSDKMNI